MERLTCKNTEDWNVLSDVSDFDKYGNVKETPTCEEICRSNNSCHDCPIQAAIDKLSDYENAEESGLLLRLPCKPGTEVFYIGRIRGTMQRGIETTICTLLDMDKIGKSFFLTKEEAEAALQAIEKKQEGEA